MFTTREGEEGKLILLILNKLSRKGKRESETEREEKSRYKTRWRVRREIYEVRKEGEVREAGERLKVGKSEWILQSFGR